jgi:hypothetical protein
MSPPRSFVERLFSVVTVHQFFDELYALEIEQLRVLFLAPVEWHTDLPGSGKDDRIFNSQE